MSEITQLQSSDSIETEPPSLETLPINPGIANVMDQIGQGLRYRAVNPIFGCHLDIDVIELEISGRIDDYDLPKASRGGIHDLENLVSGVMSRIATERSRYRPSPNAAAGEPDFISFISSAENGGFALMNRLPNVAGILTGQPVSAAEHSLDIRTVGIKTPEELVVLLGGLATILSALQSFEHDIS